MRLFPPRKNPKMKRKYRHKGRQKTSHLSINGRLEFARTVFWNQDHGTVAPMDILLGIESSNHSLGVHEICCRESLNNAFVPASENIKRLAQLDISSSVVRQIVEHQGCELSRARHKNQTGTDFKTEDCTEQTIITGTDGVMVPMVTEQQKRKRRKTQAVNRKKEASSK